MDKRTVHYDKKRIVSITEKALRYVDEQGIEFSVDFETCQMNWVIFVNSGEAFAGKNITEDDTRCVAWHDIIGKPPYIEFFSEPRTRFEFSQGFLDRLLFKNRLRQDFHRLQQAIHAAGWSTYDLS